MYVNKVILIGNVGKDPEVRYVAQSGDRLARFSLATTESWKDKASGERKSKTEWHKIVVHNDKMAELCEKYIKKGTKLYIDGKVETRSYTNPQGVVTYITEIIISKFKGDLIILSGTNEPAAAQPAGEFTPQQYMNKDIDDEIPF